MLAKAIFKSGASYRNPGLFAELEKLKESDFYSYDELSQVKNEPKIEKRNKDEIDRIVIFYKDGTFSEYKQV